MRTVLIFAHALALAHQCGVGAAEQPESCTSGSCEGEPSERTDAASLVQLRRSIVKATFPDLEKELAKVSEATDYVKNLPGADILNNLTTQAEGALDKVVTGFLTTVGDALNKTLAGLTTEAGDFEAKVEASKADITSGVASMLKKRLKLNASEVAVPAEEKYEVVVNMTLDAAIRVWAAADAAVGAAVLAMTQGLDSAGLSSAAEALNATFQAASSNVTAFLDTLRRTKGLLENDGIDDSVTLLQLLFGDGLREKLDKALTEAGGYADSFQTAFAGSFQSLEDKVVNMTQGKLGADALSRVKATFASVQRQAKTAADKLVSSTRSLLDSVGTGLKAVARSASPSLLAPGSAAVLLLASVLYAVELAGA